jgi:hypothetical protein
MNTEKEERGKTSWEKSPPSRYNVEKEEGQC